MSPARKKNDTRVEEPAPEFKPGDRRDVSVLPVRHTVLFPFALLPLNVGRPGSVQLLNQSMASGRTLAVFAQRDATTESPSVADLHPVGTFATVLRMVRSGDNQLAVLVQGMARVRIVEPIALEPWIRCRIEFLADQEVDDVETDALVKNVVAQFERVVELSPTVPDEAVAAARQQSTRGRNADFIASLLDFQVDDKQRLLEALDVKQRLKLLTEILARELQVLEIGRASCRERVYVLV